MRILIIFVALVAAVSARSVSSDEEDDMLNVDDLSKPQKVSQFREKVKSFTMKYTKDQSDIMKASDDSITFLKSDREDDLRAYKYQMSRIETEAASQSETKREIQEKISNISDALVAQLEELKEQARMLENELQLNTTKLNARKYGLQQFLDAIFDDPSGDSKLQEQMLEVDEQLVALDRNFLEKSQRINANLRDLKASTAMELNEHYRSLIDIYEAEAKQLEQLKTLSEIKDGVIDKWKEYAENADNVRSKMTSSLKDLAQSSLNYESIMAVDDMSALHDYKVIYDKTRVLIPKNDYGDISTRDCVKIVIDGDDLMATDCTGVDENELKIIINDRPYHCLRASDDIEKFFVFEKCSQRGELRNAPCEIFALDSPDIMGYDCDAGKDKSAIVVDYTALKCNLFAQLSDSEYKFGNCSLVYDDVDDYEVSGANTKFLIPRAASESDVVPCETFALRDGDEIYAADCMETLQDIPKSITFKGRSYECSGGDFRNQHFWIYELCDELTTTTLTTTTERADSSITIPNFRVIRAAEFERCKYYVIDGDGNYRALDCQVNDLSYFVIYDGVEKSNCTELNIQTYNHIFNGCTPYNNYYAPSTWSLNLDFVKVDVGTTFYIPLAANEDEEVIPCSSFSYRVIPNSVDLVFASNCRERMDYDKESVTLNGVQYNCGIVDKRPSHFPNYIVLTDCFDVYTLNFQWKEFHDTLPHLPANVVDGGLDSDGKRLYVIRKVYSDRVLYGKSVNMGDRKNGYLTDGLKETGTHDYELLTAERYVWCPYDQFQSYSDLPICRANYSDSVIPGTLLANGTCIIGYGWNAYSFTEDFEALTIGRESCEIDNED